MTNFIRTSSLFLCLFALWASHAWARLDSSVEWGYANYEESSDSSESLSASHFTQRYSMLYSTQGLLGAGRLGYYDLAAGAEWASFDSDIGDEEFSDDSFKLLYEGRVQIAPGALPFRLDAYSYDLAKSSFDSTFMEGLLSPNIVNELYDGQTIVSGVQLMAGISNGRHLGAYRDVLSQWPKLVLDYRDFYRRDLDARVPVEVRDRNLAFVSLNKKDNWFHYRLHKYTDYRDPTENTRESTIMLGTIDHRLKRHWINMTNWIQISADGSFTASEDNRNNGQGNRFDVNFFTIMRRKEFSANSLLSLQRVKDDNDHLEQTLDLPIYAINRINPDTTLRSNFELWRNEETSSLLSGDRDEQSYFGRFLLEANQRRPIVLTPSLEAESATGYRGDGQAIRGRIEANNNPRFQRKINWYGMASLAGFSGAEDDSDEDMSLWESALQVGGQYHPWSNISFGGSQYLLFGTGSYTSGLTHFVRSESGQGFGRYGNDNELDDQSFLRSTSNLFFAHSSAMRINNRFELLYEFQRGDVERQHNLELSHHLDYQSRGWQVRLKNKYVSGSDTGSKNPNRGLLAKNISSEWVFYHHGLITYRPNAYWSARLEESVNWGEDVNGQQSKVIMVREELQRSFFTFGGQRRKKGEITQSLHYEQYLNGNTRRSMTFSLSGNYYPTSYWRLGAAAYYYYRDFSGDYMHYSLTTGLDFPKFRVDFNYRYGALEDDNVVAHRYEVNVKKTF